MATEKRLIEQLLELANVTPPVCQYDKPEKTMIFGKEITVYCKPFEQFQELLRKAADALSVDSVKVVRCKDCRLKNEPGQPNILCYHMKDDDFCSYGERRSDGNL